MFCPCRLEPYLDKPLSTQTTWGLFGSSTSRSQASWARYRRPVGVNVWLLKDGMLGEGSTPPPGSIGARMFLGGHNSPVTRYEAAQLAAAGWGHCISRAA